MSEGTNGDSGTKTAQEIQEELDAYKAKTKEWQLKIKERDVKMRAQLQSSTDQIRDQQVELDGKTAEISTLKQELAAVQKENESLLELQRGTGDAINTATERVTAEYESQLGEKDNEVHRLRSEIQRLEEVVAELRTTVSGESVLFGNENAELKAAVVSRVSIPQKKASSGGEEPVEWWCWQQPNKPKSSIWLTASDSEVVIRGKGGDVPATLPRTVEEEAQLACERARELALAEAEAAAQSDAEGKLQDAATSHKEAIEALKKQLQGAEKAKAAANEDLSQAVEAHKAALADAQAKHAAAMATQREESVTQASNAAAAAKKSADATIAELQSKISTLEAYNAKAQVAMRGLQDKQRKLEEQLDASPARGTSNDLAESSSAADTERIESLESELESAQQKCEKIKSEVTAKESALRAAEEKSAELQGQVDALKKAQDQASQPHNNGGGVDAAAEAALRKELRAAEQQIASLQDELRVAKLPTTSTNSSQPDAVRREQPRPVQSRSVEVQVSAAVLDAINPSSVPPAVSPQLPEANNAAARVASVSSVESGTFDFGALLASNDASGGSKQNSVSATLAAQLRQQLDTAHYTNAELREEIRDLLSVQRHHVEQEKFLKQQLREADRHLEREKAFRSRRHEGSTGDLSEAASVDNASMSMDGSTTAASSSAVGGAANGGGDAAAAAIAENLDYLKNILVQFLSNPAVRPALVPVLQQLLALSPAETATISKAL